MDPLTLAALEFDALKELIRPSLKTPPGQRRLESLAPSPAPAPAARSRALNAEAMAHLLQEGRPGPGAFDDPDPILERLRPKGAVLDGLEIARLVGMLRAAATARGERAARRERFPLLWDVASGIADFRGLLSLMEGRIDADGRLEDSASPALGRLRRRVGELEAGLQRSLRQVLESTEQRGLLQDAYITVRNGRFVIPVKAESRTAVAGIVHGASSTGATLFVEPLESLELNNSLVTAREDEAAETRRILAEWSEALRLRLAEIEAARDRLGALDLHSAIALFGERFACTVARDGPELRLTAARHPVLEAGLAARGAACIPLTVSLRGAGGALILSGPNAGGKTVALKTIGLLALMNQAGLPVPAGDAILPHWDQIAADIGDHQSIQDSLSTFSARMVRVAGLMTALRPPALMLLDEVGAGTDPEETSALAVAIVAHLAGRGASIVATTHNEPLKAWAEVTPGAANASMEIDERTMRPTYRLMEGTPGRSGGIDLAERVGLPESVIADARARLSTGHREAQERLARLTELVAEREQELDRIRSERAEEAAALRRERSAEAREAEALRERWRRAIDAALETIDRSRDEFLAGLKDRSLALQLRAEGRRQSLSLKEQLEATAARLAPEPPPAPKAGTAPAGGAMAPGARVRLKSGGAGTGVIESVDGKGRATLLIAGKRMIAAIHDLLPAAEGPAPSARERLRLPEGVRLTRSAEREVAAELNLIGATAEEAAERLDRYLDEAWMAGLRRIRIVHGFGTGRLRQAVRALLARHPHVASHAAADEKAGGDGATEAMLKD